MELKFPKLEAMYVFFCQGRLWAYGFYCLFERKKKNPAEFLWHYTISFFHILCRFLKGLIAFGMSGPEELLQLAFKNSIIVLLLVF